jgi:F-type H+-transporting ATPase subunit delta
MKVSKAANANARRIFRLCMLGDRLDETKLRAAIRWLAERKPRGYRAILVALKRLVRLDEDRRHAGVESDVALDDATRARSSADIGAKYGDQLEFSYLTNPDLVAGLRIRVGSDVWDASVHGRLKRLANAF